MFVAKEEFLRKAGSGVEQIYNTLSGKQPIALPEFNSHCTALIVIDMVNGFVKEGPLSSDNAMAINKPIARLMQICVTNGMHCVVFADSHTMESPEFEIYPPHCLNGSAQSFPTEEIAKVGGFTLISKSSTNGFLEPAFHQWLEKHREVFNFLVVGCCTDICVQQFALTLKTDFNRRNQPSRVIVPMNLCATYDGIGHSAVLADLMSFYNMHLNGIEVTPKIEY